MIYIPAENEFTLDVFGPQAYSLPEVAPPAPCTLHPAPCSHTAQSIIPGSNGPERSSFLGRTRMVNPYWPASAAMKEPA